MYLERKGIFKRKKTETEVEDDACYKLQPEIIQLLSCSLPTKKPTITNVKLMGQEV